MLDCGRQIQREQLRPGDLTTSTTSSVGLIARAETTVISILKVEVLLNTDATAVLPFFFFFFLISSWLVFSHTSGFSHAQRVLAPSSFLNTKCLFYKGLKRID